MTVVQLRDLLHLSGAATCTNPADLIKRRPYYFIIAQPEAGFDSRKAEHWVDAFGTPTVSREWVLDCIASYQIGPIEEHLIGRKSISVLKRMDFDPNLFV